MWARQCSADCPGDARALVVPLLSTLHQFQPCQQASPELLPCVGPPRPGHSPWASRRPQPSRAAGGYCPSNSLGMAPWWWAAVGEELEKKLPPTQASGLRVSQGHGTLPFSPESGLAPAPSHPRTATWLHRMAPSAPPHMLLVTREPPELLGLPFLGWSPPGITCCPGVVVSGDPSALHGAGTMEGPGFC